MAVPFRDRSAEDDALGLAGYLRFIDEPRLKGLRGCLFCVNVRGEPINFSFTRIDAAAPLLWRPGDARRRAVTGLAAALFAEGAKAPRLLLALASETPSSVFREDLDVAVPVCRIIRPDDGGVQMRWAGQPPAPDTAAQRLWTALDNRRLATEPFDRAARGLAEAFSAR